MGYKILVLSDTHISSPERLQKLDEAIKKHAPEMDLIVHAGDFVTYMVLDYLRSLAPVKAVCGNMDDWKLSSELPQIETFEVKGKKFAVTHGQKFIAFGSGDPFERFYERFSDADIVIYGHTHRAYNRTVKNLHFFNPGSATDKRFNPQCSLGLIEVNDKIKGELVYY